MKSLYITLIVIIIVLLAGLAIFKSTSDKTQEVPEVQILPPQDTLPNTSAKMMPEALTNAQMMILGNWKSDTDAKYTVQFTADKKIDTYEGKEQSNDMYILMPQAGDAGFVVNVTDTKTNEVMTYTVVENTNTKLVLSLVGGNGQSLSFTKVQ